MRALQGWMILTINDHPDVRRLFAEFPTNTIAIQYTVGGSAKAKSAQELIIRAGRW
ncbi:hypothetical protein ACFO6Q_11405 [Dokdonella ginsengisoli]|uniref:DNA adenine methylase n=1 Tax=Dokdonella ginsengisoli TaxID=363846 RepID=A0ABV9QVY5_9GAMM